MLSCDATDGKFGQWEKQLSEILDWHAAGIFLTFVGGLSSSSLPWPKVCVFLIGGAFVKSRTSDQSFEICFQAGKQLTVA